MSRKKQAEEADGPNVPAYIVTFSDMVTLLLTFFVMLLSLAQMQDPELFEVTRDTFVTRINSFGLGLLVGQKMMVDLHETKIKHYINKPDKDSVVRTIDAKEETIRRIFRKVSEMMETERSRIVAESTDFAVTNIHFAPTKAELNEEAKKFLTQFAVDLQQNAGMGGIKLYVLGLAADERKEKKQWILSAKRAQAVADFLNETFPSKFPRTVFSWGAGPGGCWVTDDSPVYKRSQILIAVLWQDD